jgi:hypothetical protein
MTRHPTMLLLLLLFTSFGVAAHHSRATFFDMSQTVEVEGEITRVQWRHPHVRYWLQADAAYGGGIWEMETTPPSILERYGISADVLSAGTRVRVAGPPSRFKENVMEASHVLLPDGREVLLHAGDPPRWSEDTIERELQPFSDEEVRAAEATANGIFRVWARRLPSQAVPVASTFWLTDYPFTSRGREVVAAWDPLVDVDPGCLPKGMPRTMDNIWPFEFVDEGEQIRLRIEEFDIERVIRLTDDRAGQEISPSIWGYSTGRWEDGDLLVRTTHVAARYFGAAGIKLSADAILDERFTLSADQRRLDYELTVTDPVIFTEPVTQNIFWDWRPGERIKPYNCIETPGSWTADEP